jgi:uncharacterized membrane protein
MIDHMQSRPLIGAGLVLGMGLGGFADGIVLHQILQWHNMLSSVVPPTNLVDMKYNMIWDGCFHALTWTACLVGVVMLFHAGRARHTAWSARVLFGSMVAGWGLFDLVEGLIDRKGTFPSPLARQAAPFTPLRVASRG